MSEDLNLPPTRPYMIRAIYEWLEDNQLTPYLLVDATQDNLTIPTEHVSDGRIVLNIASRATGNMVIDNEFIHFNARFGGVSRELWVPMQAILGIYAKENSQGMFFDPNEYDNYTPDSAKNANNKAARPSTKPKNKAGLKILK